MGVKIREKIKGSGDWWVFINSNGFRSAKRVGSFKAAEEVALQLEAMLVLKEFSPPPPPTVSAPTVRVYSQTWLNDQIAGILDQATHERYALVLNKDILPALGHLPIDRVEPKNVRNLLNKLARDGRTTNSISLTRTVLSSCLNEAVIDGLLKTNPVKVVMRNRRRNKTVEARRAKVHKVNPFTPQEVAQFIAFMLAADTDIYGPMFLCGFRTGLRLGELVALHWEDIDWDNNVIIVRRSFKKNEKDKNGKLVQVPKPVKNGVERHVDMSVQLKAVLLELLRQRKLAAAKAGGWKISDVIFHYKGRYRTQNTVRKAFKKFLKNAGLRNIRVHDMRHTFASLLVSKGVSLAYIKDQLGHSSIKTTSDIYGHLIPRSMQHVVNELDDASNDTLTK